MNTMCGRRIIWNDGEMQEGIFHEWDGGYAIIETNQGKIKRVASRDVTFPEAYERLAYREPTGTFKSSASPPITFSRQEIENLLALVEVGEGHMIPLHLKNALLINKNS